MKLLLPTDGSDYSEGAAHFLTHLAFTRDDEVTVLHVISRVPHRDDMETYYAGLKHIKQDIAPKILDSSVNILKSLPAKIGTTLREGEPAKYIIEVAETAGLRYTGEAFPRNRRKNQGKCRQGKIDRM